MVSGSYVRMKIGDERYGSAEDEDIKEKREIERN